MDVKLPEYINNDPNIYLQRLSECVSNICPPISKFLKFKSIKERVDKVHQSKLTAKFKRCSACGSQFDSANHHVRLLPRQPMKRKLQKLLKKYSENPTSLSNYHRNCINNYLHSKNCIVITCHMCSKTTKVPCQSRPERSVQIQRQQVSEHMPCEIIAPKTRKCKRKEKKKLRKRQNKERGEETNIVVKDNNASITSSELDISKLSSPGEIKLSNTTLSSTPQNQLKDGNTSTPNIKRDSSSSRSTPVTSLLNVKMNAKRQNEIRPGKRTRSKDRHQLLTKMLAQEKKNKSLPDSLSSFLSSV